jgi:hypothetical protein
VARVAGAFDAAASVLGLAGKGEGNGVSGSTGAGRVAHGRRVKGDSHTPGAGGWAGVRADPQVVNMFHLVLLCSLLLLCFTLLMQLASEMSFALQASWRWERDFEVLRPAVSWPSSSWPRLFSYFISLSLSQTKPSLTIVLSHTLASIEALLLKCLFYHLYI